MERLYKITIQKEGSPSAVFYRETYNDSLNIAKQFSGYDKGSYIIEEGEFHVKSK
jgi:hypothetical protein